MAKRSFDDMLKIVAKKVVENSAIEDLGRALGFDVEDIHRYIGINHRYQNITHDGTLQMLRDWRKRQTESTECLALKRALKESGNIHLADDLFGKDKSDHPVPPGAEEINPGNPPPPSGTPGASSKDPEASGGSEESYIEPDETGRYRQKMKPAKPSDALLNDTERYNMDLFQKGHMFIMNITEGRDGSEVDGENIKHVFREIGYEIEYHENLTAMNLKHKLKEFVSSDRHEGKCSVAFMFMAHGKKEGIQCTDEVVTTEHIEKEVYKMESMAGKPKLVFYQCCRGNDSLDQVEEEDYDQTDPVKVVPGAGKADVMLVYAATYGNVAYRNKVKGSYFIKALCEVLLDRAHYMDLSSILEQVSGKVKKMPGVEKIRQIPVETKQGVSKKIYFLPKYPPQSASA